MAEGNHRVYVFLLSLEDSFNPTVTKIPHPPCYVVSAGYSPGYMSKEDSLDESAYEDVRPHSQVSRNFWRKFDTPYAFSRMIRTTVDSNSECLVY